MDIDLTQMWPGESGIIIGLAGGENFIRKIQRMGIRPGKKIIKVSSHFWRGPQTVESLKKRTVPRFEKRLYEILRNIRKIIKG